MKIKLQKILDDRKISIYSLSKEIGVTQNNLSKIVKGETTSIKYDILESLCITLNITPNDIFEIRSAQLTFSDLTDNSVSKTYKTISGDDALQVREQNNIYVSDNDVYEHEIQQARLNLEYEVEINLNTIIDSIILNSPPYNDLIKDINEYKTITHLPISFKLSLSSVFRLIYNILSKSNSIDDRNFIPIITKMRNTYANGGLFNLDEDSLMRLSYSLHDFLNKSNKPIELKIREDVKKSNKILKRIDIYNEYNNNKTD